MNTEIELVIKKIKKYQDKLASLQSECLHENVNAFYGSNTGGYDPDDNMYWVTVKCLNCDKSMWFDSVEDEFNYSKFGKFVKLH